MTEPYERRSIFTRLYHGETNFDFVGRRRVWLIMSAVVIGIGLVSLGVRGLNLGIDFEGGTSWEVPAEELAVPEVRDTLAEFGLADARIQELGRGTDRSIRVQASTVDEELRPEVAERLAELAGVSEAAVSINEVGPTWGGDISDAAVRALVLFLIAIAIYISLRFEWKMALATLAALFHDLLVTVGVYSVVGFEVTPATVIATLTILGYSIYDGIVVFDRVEENTRTLAATGRMSYSDMVNTSLNQVLMRSVNTSLTSLLPVFSLLLIGAGLLGAVTLRDFALALAIGLTASTYSSLFVASPLLAWLKEREPRWAGIRARAQQRGGALSPAAAAAGGGAGAGAAGGATVAEPAPAVTGPVATQVRRGGPQAPRPRKKGRRR